MMPVDHRRRMPGRSWWGLLLGWQIPRNCVSVFFRLFYGLRASGQEHIPREGPIVYVANHLSHFDPPAVGCVLDARPPGFLAQAGLFTFKPFGWLISFVGAIPIHRDRNVVKAMRSVFDELNAGRCVLLFPEGSRSPTGRMLDFKSGFLLLARRSGAPVVPCGISGSWEIFPRDRRFPRLGGRLAVVIGEPIPADELRAMGGEAAAAFVRRRVNDLRVEARASLRARTNGRFPPPGPGDEPLEDVAPAVDDATARAAP